MAAGTPIDQIFNEPAIQAQFQRVSAQLDTFAQQMVKVQQMNENTRSSNTFTSISTNIREVQTELGKLQTINANVKQSELDLVKAINTLTEALNKKASASAGTAKSVERELTAIEQLNQQYKEAVKNADSIAVALGVESDEFKAAALAANSYEQQLKEIKAARQNISTPEVAPIISTTTIPTEDNSAQNATGTVVSDLEKQQAEATITANEWAKAQRDAAAASVEVDTAVVAELTEYEALSEAIISTKLQISQVNAAIKTNADAFAAGAISEEKYVERAAALNIQQAELKQGLKQTEGEFTAQAKIVAGTSGAYDLLNARFVEAKKNAMDIAAAFGADSAQAKLAAASALQLGNQLKQIDASVGVSARKVGSYSDAITGAFSKGFGIIRQAAYILPGFGIAGIIQVIIDGITKVIDALGLFDEAFKKSATELKAYNETVNKGAEGYGKAVTEINGLREEIKLANGGYIDGEKALAHFNETIGKTVGSANSLAEAQQKLIDKSPDFIKFTFLQAEAQAAANLAIQEASKSTEIRTKALTEFTDTGDAIVSYVKNFFTKSVGSGNIAAASALDLVKKAQAEQDKQLTESKTRYDKFLELQTKFLDEAGKLSKEKGLNFYDDNADKTLKEGQVKFNSYLQNLIKARRDAQLQQLNDEAKFQQAIADLQNRGLGDNQRAIAENKASAARLEIIRINADAELALIDEQQNQIAHKYSETAAQVNADTKQSATTRAAIIAEAAKERNQQEAALEQQRQNIIVKSNQDIINEQVTASAALLRIRKEEAEKLASDTQAAYDKMLKPQSNEQLTATRNALTTSLIEGQQKAFEYQQTIRATNYATEKQQIQQQYADGKISYQSYQDSLRQIELQNQKLTLQDAISTQEAILKIYEQYGTIGSADAQKVKKLIAELKAQLSGVKIDIDTTGFDELQKRLQTIAGYINQVTDLIGGAVNASVTSQKNALQDLEDAQEANYEAEVDRINNSTLTQQQQQAELIKLEATRNAQKEANARKQRAIDREQATFQKAATIMQIITTSALAVVAELAKHSFAGAIAAAALGAAQLAIAVATPVPSFEKGGKVEKDTIAQVSEKGRELAIQQDGTMFFTPEKRSLIPLKAGTTIVPHDEVDKVLYNTMIKNTANQLTTATDPMPAIALQQLKAMKALANKKQPRTVVNVNFDSYYLNNVKR